MYHRTHQLLLALLRPLLALPAACPDALSSPWVWAALVRCIQSTAQWLAKVQDPALVQQVRKNATPIKSHRHIHTHMCVCLGFTWKNKTKLKKQALALLTQSLALPACCPYTVEAARTLASRCGPLLLSTEGPTAASLAPLLAALHATPLAADEAATLTAALLPLLLPSSSLDALATPVLQRLALAADAPPEQYFPSPNASSERHRLLADIAIAATLLRRLPPLAALDFLSHVMTMTAPLCASLCPIPNVFVRSHDRHDRKPQAWPALNALTLRSASLPTPSSSTSTNGQQRRRRRGQPAPFLLAAGLLDALTRAATLPLSARAEARNRGDSQGGAAARGAVVCLASFLRFLSLTALVCMRVRMTAGEGVVVAVVQAMQAGQLATRGT